MKKIAALPISVLAALAITACGDDSSSGPTDNPTPSSDIEQPGSSDILPGSSSDVTPDIPGSSALPTETSSSSTDPVGPEQTTSSESIATPVEFVTEAVSVPDMGCTTKPLSIGSGVAVYCDTVFSGNVLDLLGKISFTLCKNVRCIS